MISGLGLGCLLVRLGGSFLVAACAAELASRAGAVKDARKRARQGLCLTAPSTTRDLGAVGSAEELLGVVVGEPMRAEEHSAGYVGVLVHAHLRADEMRAQAALRQLQAPCVRGDGVVAGDSALLDDAEDLARHLLGVGDEGRALLLGVDGEAGVVLGDVMALQRGVGRLDGLDSGEPQLLGEQVLQGGEQPLGASPRLWRIGGDVLDTQMRESARDLHLDRARDFPRASGV